MMSNGTTPLHQLSSIGEDILITTLCITVCITILGNLLVILMVLLSHRLRRNITICLITSLAAADLLMGTLVMPFAVVEVQQYIKAGLLFSFATSADAYWPFGESWCDIWHALDVLSCTASILHLCLISLERYIAISDPFGYPTRITRRHCLVMISVCWLCSALISFPGIIWWRNTRFVEYPQQDTRKTVCSFPENRLYLFISSCVSFHIPLVVMIYVYWKIYRTAMAVKTTMQARLVLVGHQTNSNTLYDKTHRCAPSIDHLTNMHTLSSSQANSPKIYRPSSVPQLITLRDRTMVNNFSGNPSFLHLSNSVDDRSCNLASSSRESMNSSHLPIHDLGNHKVSSNERLPNKPCTSLKMSEGRGTFKLKEFLRSMARERKAAKTVSLIMGVFLVCWSPFFTYNTLKSLSPSLLKSYDNFIYPVVTWLGYLNSGINPLIYTLSLRDMHQTIHQVFCSRLKHCTAYQGHTRTSRRAQRLTVMPTIARTTLLPSANGSNSSAPPTRPNLTTTNQEKEEETL